MMDSIDVRLDALIDAVLSSEEYRQYRALQEQISLEPEKEKAINNFRRRNYLLQRNKDNIDLFDEIDKLEQEFREFRKEPLVEEYLSAELSVCRLVQKINRKLMEQVNFDTEFM
jgi:cell fate (sporulation/competence/biofilm development) regulator YmcA (YheA/YmcA/DUF963 family)